MQLSIPSYTQPSQLNSKNVIGPPYPIPLPNLREYDLIVRQEPKQARMCGVGGKADRRPIDPPPIVELRVIDLSQRKNAPRSEPKEGSPSPDGPSTSREIDSSRDDPASQETAQSYLQNPYYFMFASLAKPDDDAELHWLKDGRTRCTTGSVVSSLYHLKDPQHNNDDVGFFVFPDLSVRTEGSYRLKLSLFEVCGNGVRHCKSIYSAPFYVYTAKKFPGMEESTPLSCSLADQGIKIRIRKDIRVRKRTGSNSLNPGRTSGGIASTSGNILSPTTPISASGGSTSLSLPAPSAPGGQPISIPANGPLSLRMTDLPRDGNDSISAAVESEIDDNSNIGDDDNDSDDDYEEESPVSNKQRLKKDGKIRKGQKQGRSAREVKRQKRSESVPLEVPRQEAIAPPPPHPQYSTFSQPGGTAWSTPPASQQQSIIDPTLHRPGSTTPSTNPPSAASPTGHEAAPSGAPLTPGGTSFDGRYSYYDHHYRPEVHHHQPPPSQYPPSQPYAPASSMYGHPQMQPPQSYPPYNNQGWHQQGMYPPPGDPYAHQPPQHYQQQYMQRYDYPHPHPMYAAPPPPHYSGYYDQGQPPAGHQPNSQPYGATAPAPTATASISSSSNAPPPAGGYPPSTPNEYSAPPPPPGPYGPPSTGAPPTRNDSPGQGQMRYHHPSYYPPPPMYMQPPPQQHYGPPPYMHAPYVPTQPQTPSSAGPDPWGTPPANGPWNNGEGYPTTPNATSSLGQPPSQTGGSPREKQSDRIQLAPLRSANSSQSAYSPSLIRLPSRSSTGISNLSRERDRDAGRAGERESERRKNPLSIGSIISDSS